MKLAIITIFSFLTYLGISAEPISLFNGKDLSNWTIDVPPVDENPHPLPSFIVYEGKLVSLGNPKGHLITKESYKNYKLTAVYRFPRGAGNCGILVHTSKLRLLNNMFPQSIEVQMMHKNAGDFWCIGENIEVPEMERRRPRSHPQQAFGGGKDDARRIINLTDDSENPLCEWNTMEIECMNDEIKVHVNGTLVNHGTKATATSGKIAVQAEGAEVEFKELILTPLE